MNKDEARLQAEVEEMLRRADQTDKQEDQLYGGGQGEEGLPAELREQAESNRRSTRIPTLLTTRTGEGSVRMGVGLPDAQPAQTISTSSEREPGYGSNSSLNRT